MNARVCWLGWQDVVVALDRWEAPSVCDSFFSFSCLDLAYPIYLDSLWTLPLVQNESNSSDFQDASGIYVLVVENPSGSYQKTRAMPCTFNTAQNFPSIRYSTGGIRILVYENKVRTNSIQSLLYFLISPPVSLPYSCLYLIGLISITPQSSILAHPSVLRLH